MNTHRFKRSTGAAALQKAGRSRRVLTVRVPGHLRVGDALHKLDAVSGRQRSVVGHADARAAAVAGPSGPHGTTPSSPCASPDGRWRARP